ncbi:MAG: transposase [Cohaesibacter sp.]|nr:transposase [Cohaesibacter sp.]
MIPDIAQSFEPLINVKQAWFPHLSPPNQCWVSESENKPNGHNQHGLIEVLRWVVERTFGWFGRCRRLAKDWERSIASSVAWVTIASIRVMIRRLATYCYVK